MTAQYEALREAALMPDPVPHAASGMSVLILRGMVGWLECLPDLNTHSSGDTQPGPRTGATTAGERSELVGILAGMLLSLIGGAA